MKSTDFVVVRDDLQTCKVIETRLPDAAALPDEALLVKVTSFALTANNIVLVPIRSGIGLRLGANVGYLKYTPSATWNPF